MQEITFSKHGKGVKELRLALAHVRENNDHLKLTFEAFTNGKKPPQRFSDNEKEIISQVVTRMAHREKKVSSVTTNRKKLSDRVIVSKTDLDLDKLCKTSFFDNIDQIFDSF